MVLAPAAQAAAQPSYLFLRDLAIPSDVPESTVTGVPVGDGELTIIPPAPLDLANVQNNTAPQSRVILPAQDQVRPAQFVMLNTSLNTGTIFGPIIVLLYVPESPTVQSGNLSVQLVALPKDFGPQSVGPVGDVIASASVDLTYHNTTLPDPDTLVPPNATDPQGALTYIEGQLLTYGLTELGKARYILYLDDDVKDKIVTRAVEPGTALALRFTLVPSAAPAPIPAPLPIAQGAGQPIVYYHALTPALVYVPFYVPEPVPTSTSGPPASTTSSSSACPGCPGGSGTSSSSETQKSPSVQLVLVGLGLAVAAVAARRRVK
jgi:hypothetical protein